jgi:hypothetical protein
MLDDAGDQEMICVLRKQPNVNQDIVGPSFTARDHNLASCRVSGSRPQQRRTITRFEAI